MYTQNRLFTEGYNYYINHQYKNAILKFSAAIELGLEKMRPRL